MLPTLTPTVTEQEQFDRLFGHILGHQAAEIAALGLRSGPFERAGHWSPDRSLGDLVAVAPWPTGLQAQPAPYRRLSGAFRGEHCAAQEAASRPAVPSQYHRG